MFRNALCVPPSEAVNSREPSQAKFLTGGWRFARIASQRPCLLDIPALYRIAGLSNIHLNSDAYANDIEARLRTFIGHAKY